MNSTLKMYSDVVVGIEFEYICPDFEKSARALKTKKKNEKK